MAGTTREKDGVRRVEGKNGVRWQAKAAIPGLRPAFKTFGSKTDAKRWKISTEAAMTERRYFAYAEADKRTFGQMIDRYLELQIVPGTKQQVLRKWRDHFSYRPLSDIGPADIIEFREKLRTQKLKNGEKRAPGTVNRYLAYLSTVYTQAIKEWQWTSENPVKAVNKLREPKGRVRYLEKAEITSLLDACKASGFPNLYPLVVLALSCGARAGELLDLRWPDVDLGRGRATLHNTKNKQRRFISIKGKALEVLKTHAKVKRIDTDRVFPSVNGISRFNYAAPFSQALRVAGIKDFRFHDLRHTCASYLAMNGASAIDIAAVLGHKTLAMTHRYSHLADSHVDDVVERMNKKLLNNA